MIIIKQSLIVTIALYFLMLAHISNAQTLNVDPPVTAVTIESVQSTDLVLTGTAKTIQLTATVTPASANPMLTWAITNSPIPAGYTINANNGQLSVAATAASETIYITATSSNGIVGANVLTFKRNAIAVTITSTVASQLHYLTRSFKEIALSATVTPADASQIVIWSIINNPMPKGYLIDNDTDKLVVSANAVPATITLKATSTNGNPAVSNGVVSSFKSLTFVIPKVTAVSIENLAPSELFTRAKTIQLPVTIAPAEANQTLIWEITNNPVPAGYSINTNTGELTLTVAAMPTTIMVKATSLYGSSSNYIVTATKSYTFVQNPTSAITNININNPTSAISLGNDVDLKALLTIVPAGETLDVVTFEIQPEGTPPAIPIGYTIQNGVLKSELNTVKDLTVSVIATTGSVTSQPKIITFPAPILTNIITKTKTGKPVEIRATGFSVSLTDFYDIITVPPTAEVDIRRIYYSIVSTFGNTLSVKVAQKLIETGIKSLGTVQIRPSVYVPATGNQLFGDTVTLYVKSVAPYLNINPVTNEQPIGTPLILDVTFPNDHTGDVTWRITPPVSGYSINQLTGEITSVLNQAMPGDVIVSAALDTINPRFERKITITFFEPVTAVAIDNVAPNSLVTGAKTIQLTATVTPANTNKSLSWTIKNNPVPAGYSINTNTGELTLTTAATPATIMVTAISAKGNPDINNGNVPSHTKSLTFVEPTLQSISIARTDTMTGNVDVTIPNTLNLATTYTVIATPIAADTGLVTWSIDPQATETGRGTIKGNVFTPSTPGMLTLQAMANGQTDTVVINIIQEPVMGIIIRDVAAGHLFTGARTIQLTALILPIGANQTLSWAITNNPIPNGYSINANTGLITLTAAATPATISVTATTRNGYPSINGGVLTSPAKSLTFVNPTLTSLSIARTSGTGTVDVTMPNTLDLATTYTVTGMPAGATVGTVTWTVDQQTVETGMGTITGNVFTPSAPGMLTIKATAGGQSDTVVINIIRPALTSISIARTDTMTSNVEVTMPNTLDLANTYTVTGIPSIADVGTVTWTVDQQTGETGMGTITGNVFTPSAPGMLTLQATANGQTDTVVINIFRLTLQSISIIRKTGTGIVDIAIPNTLNLANTYTITGMPAAVDLGTVAWSVYRQTGVTGTGTITGNIFTPTTPGVITLQATANGKTDTVVINIVRPTLQSISISRTSGTGTVETILPNTLDLTATFTVTGMPALATLGTVTWSVDKQTGETGMGTISGNVFTPTTIGMLTLKATTNGLSNTVVINIKQPAATTVFFHNVDFNLLYTGAKTIQLDTNVIPIQAIQTVTYRIINNPIPNGYSINTNTGLLTLTAAAMPATIMVTATSANGAGGTNVVSPTKSLTFARPTLSSISVARTDTMTGNVEVTIPNTLNLENTYTVTGLPAGNTIIDNYWLVDQQSGETGRGTIAGSVIFTPTAPGMLTLKIISRGITNTVTINIILVQAPVTTVTIDSVAPNSLVTGAKTIQLTATVTPANTNKSLSWTIKNNPVPAGYSINTNTGELTLSATAMPTTIMVTATSTNGVGGANVVSPTKSLTFVRPTLSSISIARTSGIGNVDVTLTNTLDLTNTYTVTGMPAGAMVGTVTWTVDAQTGEMGMGTIDATTNVFTPSAPGMLTIKATAGGQSDTVVINIIRPALTSISIARTDIMTGNVEVTMPNTLNLENTYTVTGLPAGATVGTVTWTVDAQTGETGMGTIDATTNVFTPSAPGMLTLQATANGQTSTVTISIVRPPVTVVAIDNVAASFLFTGARTIQLTATITPAIANQTLSWAIANNPIPNGYSINANTGELTLSAAAMPTTIMVTATSANGVGGANVVSSAKSLVFVAPTLQSLSITRTSGTGTVEVTVGATLDLDATFRVTPTPTGASVGTLEWTVQATTGTKAGGTIANNVFTAGTVAGTVTLTITSQEITGKGARPTRTATVDITITETVVTPTSITITRKTEQENTTAIVGTALDLTTVFDVVVEPTKAAQTVTWSVKTDSASAGTITGTELTASAAGTITLVATSTVATTVMSDDVTITAINSMVTGLQKDWITDNRVNTNTPSQILSLSAQENELQIAGLSEENKVYVYTRTGHLIWKTENYPTGLYSNGDNYFRGVSNINGEIIKTGTYFLVIENALTSDVEATSHIITIVE